MRKTLAKLFHDRFVYSRRMTRLTELLYEMLGDSNSVLDVGCGDGMIDYMIMNKSQGTINIIGVDILVREKTYIPVIKYDGVNIPVMRDGSRPDTIMTVDVLHHTDNPAELVTEMARSTEKYLIIKDHYRHGLWSLLKLRLMDYVGNAHYGVRLPYNYLKPEEWDRIFAENGLEVVERIEQLDLYTGVFHLLFDSNLHYIIKLKKKAAGQI